MGNSGIKSPTKTNAPPIPPKPHTYQNRSVGRDIDTPHCFTSTSEQLYEVVENAKMLSDPKPIGTLVAEFYSHLPLCFSVSESMYGICGDSSLLEGQLLSAHFVKEMKVVSVKARQTGVEYKLPVCSSLVASVLYDPEKKPDKSRRGYEFNGVASILKANPMPRMVCTLTAFEDLEGNLVEKNEILFIQTVSDYENSNCLICINVKSGKSLRMGESCTGKFTTAVEKMGISLSKVIEFMKLPVDVAFNSPADGSIALPPSALSANYTIENVKKEKSLIVSTKYTSETSCLIETVELFLSVSLDVQLVDLPSKELEKLRKETKMLYQRFQPFDVSKVICDLDSSINYVQTALYTAIRRDSWRDEVTIVRPKPPGLQNVAQADDEEEYIDMEDFYADPGKPPSHNLSSTPSVSIPSILTASSKGSPVTETRNSPKVSTFPRNVGKKPKQRQPIPPNVEPRRVTTRQHSEDLHVPPYLVAHRVATNTVDHERPYDYVKFSKDIQLEALQKEVEQLKKEKSEYQSFAVGTKAAVCACL